MLLSIYRTPESRMYLEQEELQEQKREEQKGESSSLIIKHH